ncbi:hypothetical protein PoB_005044600 [Plakobranchus ocellatus]|uniref:Uncharacterized protein n=1 Tax=Plakobranchus ocellatus TaxID=259542 RepID=A0AAV4BXU7_9GAST|nr:hypothetical protein PoB_005044600 [Plakobranchus ocellatus]
MTTKIKGDTLPRALSYTSIHLSTPPSPGTNVTFSVVHMIEHIKKTTSPSSEQRTIGWSVESWSSAFFSMALDDDDDDEGRTPGIVRVKFDSMEANT